MLLPLRIVHAYERAPVATWALIGLNIGVHVLSWVVGADGMRPFVLDTRDFALHQLVSSTFLHANLIHLAGNMLFLWVYGRYVEDRVGPWLLLIIYMSCAVVGDMFFAAFDGGRAVGASGAISGVMGFVLVGAPWAEVTVLFVWGPYAAVNRTFEVAAFFLVGLWVVLQVLSAVAGWGAISRVAYSAHIGGCFAGALIAWYLRSPACKGKTWYLDPAPPGGGVAATRRLNRARGTRLMRERDPGIPRFHVVLLSVRRAPSRVAILKLLVKLAGMAPEEAHSLIEDVEAGTRRHVPFDGEEAAERFSDDAQQLGARVALPPPASPARSEPAPARLPLPSHEERGGEDVGPSLRLASGQEIELESDPE